MLQMRSSYLTFLLCWSSCLAVETGLVSLSNSVGDAIDAAERDKYGLFPDVQQFRDARFLLTSDAAIQAVVTTGEPRASGVVTYRLSSLQFERIRFLVNNSDYVLGLTAQNPHAARALRRFWMDIERTGVTDRLAQFEGYPFDEGSDGVWLGKEFTTLTGATIGSGVGAWLATSIATRKVAAGYRLAQETEPCTETDIMAVEDCNAECQEWQSCPCGPAAELGCVEEPCNNFACCGTPTWAPNYRTNWAIYYGTYVGVTALGAGIGYVVGRDDVSELWGGESWGEMDGRGKWTTACLGVLPGLVLGGLYVSWARTLYGREDGAARIENGNELQVIPAVITGVCIAVELTLLANKLSQTIGRSRAARRSGAGYAYRKASVPDVPATAQDSRLPDTLSAGKPSRP